MKTVMMYVLACVICKLKHNTYFTWAVSKNQVMILQSHDLNIISLSVQMNTGAEKIYPFFIYLKIKFNIAI